jgi:hypothetical protein
MMLALVFELTIVRCRLMAHSARWPLVRNRSEAGMDSKGERRD